MNINPVELRAISKRKRDRDEAELAEAQTEAVKDFMNRLAVASRDSAETGHFYCNIETSKNDSMFKEAIEIAVKAKGFGFKISHDSDYHHDSFEISWSEI